MNVACECCLVLRLLLLQCGDAEENPGPMAVVGQEQLNDMLALRHTIKEKSTRLEAGYENIKDDVKNMLNANWITPCRPFATGQHIY